MFNSPLRETAVLAAAMIVVRSAFACFFSAVWFVGFEVRFGYFLVLVSSKTIVGGPFCIIVATLKAFLYEYT